MPKYLFAQWGKITKKIETADYILLLLDFDGTLSPIVSRPEKAVLAKGMKPPLISLTKKENFSIGVITGRRLEDVQKLVKIRNIYYAGNHGLQIKGPDIDFLYPRLSHIKDILQKLTKLFEKALRGVKGVIIENKRFGLSVHYRLVEDRDVGKVKEIFKKVASPFLNKRELKTMSGKKVLELVPSFNWNKGKALKLIEKQVLLAKNLKKGKVITIYLGDDRTDEDAFKVLTDKGISVHVGNLKNSKAKYSLKNSAEVKNFLIKLTKLRNLCSTS